MSFFFVPTATLPLVTSQSPEGTTIGMDISVLLVPYGWQYSTATNLNSGYVTVAILYTNGAPTAVSLQDYNFSATGPGNYSWEWWDALGGFFINGSGTASSQVTFDSAPGPQNPFYPVYGNIHNQVTFTNVPFGTSGTLAYTNAEYLLFTSSGTIDMSGSGVDSTNANPATVFVTNGVIWLQMPFTSWGSNGTPFLSGSSAEMTFTSSGQVVATGPVPAAAQRALVWNNGADTADWNTSDANWNAGTAVWNNDAPDNAVFTNTGVGTVTLTMPMTAGWLWFSYPGYTITGSTLALTSTSAITNDADATVASAIISGVVNKWGLGTLTLSGANTYSGASTVNAGTLQLGSSGALPGTDLIFGSSASTLTLDLHGYSGTVAALTGGPNATVDNLSGGTSTLSVGNNGASSSFSGVIQNTAGTVSLAKIGSGTLTLAAANTYSGDTIVSAGTLALGSGASLSSASSVSIAAGATFDVSAAPGGYYLLGSGAMLTASGTGSPATINGPPYGGTLDLGSRPIVLNYDGTHPALTVAQSSLNLSGNTITVNSPLTLSAGSYPLIQVTGGGIIYTNGSFTVNGTAIGDGYGATVSVNGNELMLNVVQILASSTTKMGPFAPTQTYGSVVLGATVSPSSATGTVTFYNGTTNVGTATLSGGVATGPAIASLLPVGLHAITAKYGATRRTRAALVPRVPI